MNATADSDNHPLRGMLLGVIAAAGVLIAFKSRLPEFRFRTGGVAIATPVLQSATYTFQENRS